MILSFRRDRAGQMFSSQIRLLKQSDQGLHCFSFHLHLLEAFLCGKTTLLKYHNNQKKMTTIFFRCPKFLNFNCSCRWDLLKKQYCKNPKNLDTRKICFNYPKIYLWNYLIWIFRRVKRLNAEDGMANSVDPDQTAPLGAVWSGSTLFAQTCLSENLGKFCTFKSSFALLGSEAEAGRIKRTIGSRTETATDCPANAEEGQHISERNSEHQVKH